MDNRFTRLKSYLTYLGNRLCYYQEADFAAATDTADAQ